MSEVSAPKTGAVTVPLMLPDATSTAALVLSQAMEYCAQKMGLRGAQAAIDALKRGDHAACGYCHYSVARHVAESLGALDENVKAVYSYEYDETPDDDCPTLTGIVPPLHLVAWVAFKSAALASLVEGLDRALVHAMAQMIGLNPAATLLDIHFADDRDVELRIGYGALLAALHRRPIKVWER